MTPPLQGATILEVEASWQQFLRVIETVFDSLVETPDLAENLLKAEWTQLKLHWVAASPACIAATGEEKCSRIREHIQNIGKQLDLALDKIYEAQEEWQDSPSATNVRGKCRLLEIIRTCLENGISTPCETEERNWLRSYSKSFPNVVKQLKVLRNSWRNPRPVLVT